MKDHLFESLILDFLKSFGGSNLESRKLFLDIQKSKKIRLAENTPLKTNMTVENQPWMTMHLLINMLIFQPAMLVNSGVYISFSPHIILRSLWWNKLRPENPDLRPSEFVHAHQWVLIICLLGGFQFNHQQMSSVQNPYDIPLYWLVNRDPYNGLYMVYYNPYITG